MTTTQANLKISQQIWLASGSNKNLTVADQAQRAWQLLTDFQNWQKWQPNILSTSRTDSDGPGRFRQFQESLKQDLENFLLGASAADRFYRAIAEDAASL